MTTKVYGAPESEPLFKGTTVLFVGALLALVGAGAWIYSTTDLSARLAVNTNPVGASVFVNGRLAGATPLSVGGLKQGGYTLRIEKEGFAPLIKNIQLAGADLELRESLKRNGMGSLNVDIRPYGAEVLLDGEFFGHTPLQREDVPVGPHELLIRKTNFKPYMQRVELNGEEQLSFKDFQLEDIVLAMLRNAVEADKQRVSNYMDLGHYLFVNNEMDESAEVYAKALAVANTPLEFAPTADATEKALEQRLRAEDMNRLNEEIRKKSHWPGKDVAKWASVLRKQQEEVAGNNPTDWATVNEQVQNFIRDDKLERAQALLLKHISLTQAKNNPLLPQAYVSLLSLRLKMHNLDGVRETYTKFSDLFSTQPTLARQAANTIYSAASNFQGEPQKEVLAMAEKLLRKSVAATVRGRGDPELHALCEFELANVLTLQSHGTEAVPLYKSSVDGTRDQSTKELRNQKLVECLIKIKGYAEGRAVLAVLATSARPEVVRKAGEDLAALEAKAKEDLKEKESVGPSPEQK
jgi:hypothetical protein